ncbi:MAG TPA: RsmG family class I SAM-dependent methyltransferase, partial [Candidatus Krumholzibacteria bacterium]|nr:RsmG family class I SAM-dependent methyltransferase [Candidatus Krumholzibacteria bacterium]
MSVPENDLETTLADVVRLFPALSIDPLRRYTREILRWNDEIGLVSRKHPVAACHRLLIESAEFGGVVAGVLAPDRSTDLRVADVGSGAGFPGFVWRMLFPGWDLALIERREKKAVFLEQIVRQFSFSRVEVFAGDARAASHLERYRASFDVVATMAVGAPSRTAPEIEDLLVAGGVF